jgi:hypothetical protein
VGIGARETTTATTANERSMTMRPEYKSRLLRCPDREDTLVRKDVFVHGLEPYVQEALRQAAERDLKPSGFDIAGDDNSIVILRFTRPVPGKREEREASLAAQGES